MVVDSSRELISVSLCQIRRSIRARLDAENAVTLDLVV